MTTVLATIALFALLMGAMALGLTRGRVLQGSCGGSGEECACDAIKRRRCQHKQAAEGIVTGDGNRHLDVLPPDEDLR